MRNTKKWMPNEIGYLKKHYLDSISDLTQKLGRSWSSIHHKTNRLGLVRQGRVPHPFQGKKHPRRHIFDFEKMTPEIAYLLGVYLGDGSVYKHKTGATLSLSCIDEDFVQKTQKAVQKTLGYLPNYSLYQPKKQYLLRVCSTDFAEWLTEITNNKRKVPSVILEANTKEKKAFLTGLFDSEASITRYKDKRYRNGHHYQMYFAVKSSWIAEIQKLLADLGVKTSPIRTTSGIPRFTVNKLSFYKSGLRFSIMRKQHVIEKYVLSYHPKEI